MPDMQLVLPALVWLGGLIAIIQLGKKDKKKEKTLVIWGMVGFFLVYGAVMLYVHVLRGAMEEEVDPEATRIGYQKAAAVVLGREIIGKFPAKNMLIIAKHGYFDDPAQMAMVDAIRETVAFIIPAERLLVSYFDPATDSDGQPREPNARDFDDMVRRYWQCELIVSMVGLPDDLERMRLWNEDKNKRPRLAVLAGIDVNSLGKVKKRIAEQSIAALVMPIPGKEIPTSEPAPEAARQAFDQCFILVNHENIEDTLGKYGATP